MSSTQRAFSDAFLVKIQKQLEDIGQINIMTAISANLTGSVHPEAKSLMRFLEAKPNEEIPSKKIDYISLDATDLKKSINPKLLEAPDITKKHEDLNATVLMRTIMELDGDIALLIRSQETDTNGNQIVSLENDILTAHHANVKVALENWHFYLTAMLQALKILIELAKPGG
jgi:hypothetical protein